MMHPCGAATLRDLPHKGVGGSIAFLLVLALAPARGVRANVSTSIMEASSVVRG
jgi:hypothetical protein